MRHILFLAIAFNISILFSNDPQQPTQENELLTSQEVSECLSLLDAKSFFAQKRIVSLLGKSIVTTSLGALTPFISSQLLYPEKKGGEWLTKTPNGQQVILALATTALATYLSLNFFYKLQINQSFSTLSKIVRDWPKLSDSFPPILQELFAPLHLSYTQTREIPFSTYQAEKLMTYLLETVNPSLMILPDKEELELTRIISAIKIGLLTSIGVVLIGALGKEFPEESLYDHVTNNQLSNPLLLWIGGIGYPFGFFFNFVELATTASRSNDAVYRFFTQGEATDLDDLPFSGSMDLLKAFKIYRFLKNRTFADKLAGKIENAAIDAVFFQGAREKDKFSTLMSDFSIAMNSIPENNRKQAISLASYLAAKRLIEKIVVNKKSES